MTEPASTKSIGGLRGTQTAVEFASHLLSAPSLGLSGAVGTAVNATIQRRIEALRDTLVADLRSGRIAIDDAINVDDLASYLFRLQRAAIEGCAKRKLSIVSRYFFRAATDPNYKPETLLDVASIVEQLSDNELRSLAVIKGGIVSGQIKVGQRETGIGPGLSLMGLFPDLAAFHAATKPLVRFGFIDLISGYGSLVIFPMQKLTEFLEHLDLEDLRDA